MISALAGIALAVVMFAIDHKVPFVKSRKQEKVSH